MLARSVVQIIGSLAIMFWVSWKLTLVLLSVVPPVAIGAVWYGKRVSHTGEEESTSDDSQIKLQPIV